MSVSKSMKNNSTGSPMARNNRDVDDSDPAVFLTQGLKAVIVNLPVRHGVLSGIAYDRIFLAIELRGELNVCGSASAPANQS